jgi:hypothetical protein
MEREQHEPRKQSGHRAYDFGTNWGLRRALRLGVES